MRRAPVTTLKGLLAEHQAIQTSTQRPVWDTAIVGLTMIDDVFDQFINQILPTTGFVWGSSVWGVDAVDSESSNMASQYGLN
jgi:hypothetical protein